MGLDSKNDNEKLYRIREFKEEYTIEKKLKSIKGVLWWKKPHEEWRPIDVDGRCCVYNNFEHGNEINTYLFKMPPFKTLEDAEKKVEKLKTGPIFHYI